VILLLRLIGWTGCLTQWPVGCQKKQPRPQPTTPNRQHPTDNPPPPQALVFDSEEDMLEALAKDPARFKGTVIVIRYEGPKVRGFDSLRLESGYVRLWSRSGGWVCLRNTP
jgi:hypothetical protein